MNPTCHIGTAGWSLPREHAARFCQGASHLARYASRLNAAEINSSFHRPHRPATYARWAASVPQDFRFAVKVPKTITHERRLAAVGDLLAQFLAEVGTLGTKLGPLLVQLPPSLAFDRRTVRTFFTGLRKRHGGAMVCEPRHASWFAADADALLTDLGVGRAAADPARVPGAGEPGGDRSVSYFRWHGTPRVYYSEYAPEQLAALATRLRAAQAIGSDVWCIFDNTVLGNATANALAMRDLLSN